MNDFVHALLDLVMELVTANPLFTAIVVGALFFTVFVVYCVIPATLALWDRVRRRIPKELHRELTSLLSNFQVIELYEPSQRYLRDLVCDSEGKTSKPSTKAWLSPYRRAVKATSKRKGRTPSNQFFAAREQIREAAKHVKVRKLTKTEAGSIVTPEHAKEFDTFAIVLAYDGHAPADVEKLIPAIASQLGLKELFGVPDDNPFAMTLIASKHKLEDALVKMKRGAEFFNEHPATSPKSTPMAFTADGRVYSQPTHHTLTYGMTGSGKSGPFLAFIRQQAKFIDCEQPIVELYGIDPKAADLRLFQESCLFKRIVTETDDAIELINDFHHRMNRRQREAVIDLDRGITGQSFEPRPGTPYNILIIDELFALRNALFASREGKAAWTNLENIFAKGRSAGFFVQAASQQAKEEHLNTLRSNFGNVIVLSQNNPYLNDLFLGAGAKENGFDSTAIPMSTPDNNFRYAGIGYVKGETGEPLKIRIAYQSTEDLIDFIKQHPAKKRRQLTRAEANPTKLLAHIELADSEEVEDDIVELW